MRSRDGRGDLTGRSGIGSRDGCEGILKSLLQRLRNAVESLIDRGDLVLRGFDLGPRCGVEGTNRRSALRALHECKLLALADGGEQREFKAVPAAFDACRDRHFRPSAFWSSIAGPVRLARCE